MLDVDVLQVLLQILGIAIVEILTQKGRNGGIKLVPVPAIAVLLPLLRILLPGEQLQDTIGVVMGCVNAIAVDLVIAFKGRGQFLPAIITGSLWIRGRVPEKASV